MGCSDWPARLDSEHPRRDDPLLGAFEVHERVSEVTPAIHPAGGHRMHWRSDDGCAAALQWPHQISRSRRSRRAPALGPRSSGAADIRPATESAAPAGCCAVSRTDSSTGSWTTCFV